MDKMFNADRIASLSLDGYNGLIAAFYPSLHTIRPHKGQIETAKNIAGNLGQQYSYPRPRREHLVQFTGFPATGGENGNRQSNSSGALRQRDSSVSITQHLRG